MIRILSNAAFDELLEVTHAMIKSTKTLLACAALSGLYAGALSARSYGATPAEAGSKHTVQLADKDKASCSGKDGCSAKDKDSCKGLHDCKGKNACKGQGGCKSGDNGCRGKNSCKGHGGCSTAQKPADHGKA